MDAKRAFAVRGRMAVEGKWRAGEGGGEGNGGSTASRQAEGKLRGGSPVRSNIPNTCSPGGVHYACCGKRSTPHGP